MANVDCFVHLRWVYRRSSHCTRSQCDNSGQDRVRFAVGERSVELRIDWTYVVQEFHIQPEVDGSIEG
jgi:hypothetical protein